ncbi:MAG: formyltransferase family protein, partial [candidate division WOR-3 bacterium]|nr:formyltransferase family protein [candidate division WOR-3 bacterium]
MKSIVILISGSGTNMESLIAKSRSQGMDVRFTVICDNPSAKGISRARKLGVETIIADRLSQSPCMNSEDEEIFMDLLSGINPDFILLAGFMRIISAGIIEHYKNRIINIHPSLLPSFKGRDAQKQAFDYGVKVSGCTVHFIDS